MVPGLLDLFWPHARAPWLDRRRAEAITDRVRAFAYLFAVATAAWVPIDLLVFEPHVGWRLAALRAGAAAAYFALALECRAPIADLRRAEIRLAFLFAIPAIFFVVSVELLAGAHAHGAAATLASLYSFVPFVLAAGIGAFPLAAVESTALSTIAFLAEGWALIERGTPVGPLVFLDAFWLLVLIACVAAFSAMSQMRLLEELVQQAIRDPLTGCHRRESGKEFLDMQLLLSMRLESPLTIVFADLDRFKDVNDRYGHDAGDQVLATAAAALRTMTRDSDLVLRWGGEEFVVVLPHTDRREAVALLDRLRSRGLGRHPDGAPVTVSMGIAEYPGDAAPSSEALIELADRRMYQAKQAGRNRFVQGADAEARTLLACTSAVSR